MSERGYTQRPTATRTPVPATMAWPRPLSSAFTAAPVETEAQPDLQTQLAMAQRMQVNWSQMTVGGTPSVVQPKLTVGAPNDQYEQEADRVADQVMSMPDAATPAPIQREAAPEEEELQTKPLAAAITPLVQREMAPEEEDVQAKLSPDLQREEMPEAEEIQTKPIASIQREAMPEEEEVVQMKGSPDTALPAGSNLESRLSSSQGGGSPLPEEVRTFMEPRFGADFSQVRVHTGSEAVQMNRDLNAQAFTHKQDVYFGAGKAPAKNALTAHELTHVVQQTGRVQAQKVPDLSAVQLKCATCGREEIKGHRSLDNSISFKSLLNPSVNPQATELQIKPPEIQRAKGESGKVEAGGAGSGQLCIDLCSGKMRLTGWGWVGTGVKKDKLFHGPFGAGEKSIDIANFSSLNLFKQGECDPSCESTHEDGESSFSGGGDAFVKLSEMIEVGILVTPLTSCSDSIEIIGYIDLINAIPAGRIKWLARLVNWVKYAKSIADKFGFELKAGIDLSGNLIGCKDKQGKYVLSKCEVCGGLFIEVGKTLHASGSKEGGSLSDPPAQQSAQLEATLGEKVQTKSLAVSTKPLMRHKAVPEKDKEPIQTKSLGLDNVQCKAIPKEKIRQQAQPMLQRDENDDQSNVIDFGYELSFPPASTVVWKDKDGKPIQNSSTISLELSLKTKPLLRRRSGKFGFVFGRAKLTSALSAAIENDNGAKTNITSNVSKGVSLTIFEATLISNSALLPKGSKFTVSGKWDGSVDLSNGQLESKSQPVLLEIIIPL
jgi:hypothetical protein